MIFISRQDETIKHTQMYAERIIRLFHPTLYHKILILNILFLQFLARFCKQFVNKNGVLCFLNKIHIFLFNFKKSFDKYNYL